MGRVHDITNVEDVAEDMTSAGVGEGRWPEAIQDDVNNLKVVITAVLTGVARNLDEQGRVSPVSVGTTAMQDMRAANLESHRMYLRLSAWDHPVAHQIGIELPRRKVLFVT